MDYVAFNIILDDIICPNGTTYMGMLGGGGPQTAFGMKLWADSVGLVAGVGPDLPQKALDWLEHNEIDTQGIRKGKQPTSRAWQALESDGRRTQVWRVSPETIHAHLQRRINLMPDYYQHAKGVHFGIHPLEPDSSFIRALTENNAVVSLEPFRPAGRPLSPSELKSLIANAAIFSPNLDEARSLVPSLEKKPLQAEITTLLAIFLDAGAQVVSLRMGPEGSWIASRHSSQIAHIPAFKTSAVDPVGAGNAYCGGFLVGWLETGNLVQAGLHGAVSASFLVEQIGVPPSALQIRSEARKRLISIQSLVESYSIQ
jgi:cytidine kinase